MNTSRAISLLACFAFLLSTATGQQAPVNGQKTAKSDTLRIETELVQLEVTVMDKLGKLVKDLRKEDFEVREDGKIQDLSYFSLGSSTKPARWITAWDRAETVAGAPLREEARAGRYFVIAIDDLHLAFANLGNAKTAMHKFVNEQLTPNDQVALVTTSGQMAMYQQFSSDKVILNRAIDRLTLRESQAAVTSSDPPRITPYQAELIDSNQDPDALTAAVNEIIRTMPEISKVTAVSLAQSKARTVVAQNNGITRATLGTLENVIKGLKGLPGRKSLVLVSDGFLLGGPGQSLQSDVRRITDAAVRSGLVIYGIDARGLVGIGSEFDASAPGFAMEDPPGAHIRIESAATEATRDALTALSRDTGGFPLFNSNDLSLGFKRVLENTETYYLIAYEPVMTYRDGRYRKLEIQIKGHPEYRVRSSHGYFAPDEKALARDAERDAKERQKVEEERIKNPKTVEKRELDLKAESTRTALNSLYPLRGIPVKMSVDFIDTGKGSSYASILAHIDISSAQFETAGDRHNADFEIFGVIFNEKGVPMEGFSQVAQMRLRKQTLEQAKTNGLVFQRRIQLPPGFYQVRLGTRNVGARQLGSDAAWVEIPDLSKKSLVLSSVFLTMEREGVDLLQDKGERNLEDQPGRVPAQIDKRFRRGEKFDYAVFAYNCKPDSSGGQDAVIQTLIYSGRKLVLATPVARMSTPAGSKGATFLAYAARLNTSDFDPGSYELRAVVLDRVTNASATKTTRFTVE